MRLLFAVAYLLLIALAMTQYLRWRRVVHADGAFRCKIRLSAGRSEQWPRLRDRWSRRRLRARWVGDELVVWRRPVLLLPVRLRARICRDGIYRLTVLDVKRCGYRPVAIEIELSDGSRIEVATTDAARVELVGPYLAAALKDLPRAPRRRRHIRGSGS
jgi:hypothetical protein